MTAELKKSTRIFTALASIWSNIFTNSNEKKTCLLLCLICVYSYFEEDYIVGKNVHATIPNGNMGFDQDAFPDTLAVELTFATFL